MTNPIDVLNYKIDLMARLTRPFVKTFWAKLIANRVPEMILDVMTPDELFEAGYASVQTLRILSDALVPYYVRVTAAQVIETAAKQLTDKDKLVEATTPFGIMQFEKPVELIDESGVTTKISWLVWHPCNLAAAIKVWVFNDGFDYPTIESKPVTNKFADYEKNVGPWNLLACFTVVPGSPVNNNDPISVLHTAWSLMLQSPPVLTSTGIKSVNRKQLRRLTRENMRDAFVYLVEGELDPKAKWRNKAAKADGTNVQKTPSGKYTMRVWTALTTTKKTIT